jgi:phospholipid/cholesterol/gamma-HCH transport system permease protein
LSSAPLLNAVNENDILELRPSGSWTAAYATTLETLSDGVSSQIRQIKALKVDMAGVSELDTLGAWLLRRSRGKR